MQELIYPNVVWLLIRESGGAWETGLFHLHQMFEQFWKGLIQSIEFRECRKQNPGSHPINCVTLRKLCALVPSCTWGSSLWEPVWGINSNEIMRNNNKEITMKTVEWAQTASFLLVSFPWTYFSDLTVLNTSAPACSVLPSCVLRAFNSCYHHLYIYHTLCQYWRTDH